MHRILIVEDDKSIAELERDYLEINGFKCDIAEDGRTGLARAVSEALRVQKPDTNMQKNH